MAEVIDNLLAAGNIDIVHIEHTYMASYSNRIHAKKVISIQNIGSVQFLRMFKIERKLRTKIRWFINWRMMKDWEPRVLRNFDRCLTMSSLDEKYLRSACPELKLSVIENGVDVERYRPLSPNEDKKSLLYLGSMSYEPNSDAVLHFCSRILPLIRKEIPQCRFFIVGKNPSQDLRNLADGESVSVTGYVDDPVPYYQRCDILVVPLRAGGGSRLKILESMALGRPVVSTSIGCEGLEVRNDQHLLIADPPQEFARQCVRLLTDNSLYDRMALQGRKLVEQKYSWDRISNNLQEVYSRLEEKT
jgi:glycosyltransferase involved in cell wall biosynthesis